MEDIQNQTGESKENLQEEQELLKEPESDAIHKEIIEKYGLDEEIDKDLIEKIVNDRIVSGKKLSTAIKQKIGYRTKLNARTEQKPEEKPQVTAKPKETEVDEVVGKKVGEELEKRELEALDLSDELKQELKTYAKASGTSIKKALQSDYFKYLKEQADKKVNVEEAAIGGKRRALTSKELSTKSPKDFDLTTEEGRKGYEEWKKVRK